MAALVITSCGMIKKDANSNKSGNESKQDSAVQRSSDLREKAMFSISEDELKNSESGPHVVYFATNSAILDAEAVSILSEKVVAEAKNAKTKKVVIEAHCDERGSTTYNKKLSDRRALAVKKYLVKNGVKAVKIKTVGYGKSKPVALGHDEESWAKNRRAVTISIKK